MNVLFILIFLPIFTWGAERNESCTTPNGDLVTCIPFLSCDTMRNAVLRDMNGTSLEFARNSQCGYDSEPLVCCGPTAYPIEDLRLLQSRLLPNGTECGINLEDDRIFGGTVTELGEFPWMALLQYKNVDGTDIGFKCGGTLINSRYVLTAAHCVRTDQDTVLESVRLGEWRISTAEDCYESAAVRDCVENIVDFKVEKTVGHSNYSRRSGDNDIGLIRLKENVEYSEFIRPICLPSFYSPLPEIGAKLVISGWGSMENAVSSDFKLKADVPTVSHEICSSKIKRRGTISENQLCAGGKNGADACQGDSGGPLMRVLTKAGAKPQWYQEGVIAWGIGCGMKNLPGVYTRVAKYTNWILDNMAAF